ncbi:MAG: DUF4097 family beta strand repeat protein [Caryophanon sp.]|nr:DUF4097 family beta strand repeat protein [Caryophanon sp.]
MQNERARILQLVENGTISAQEALTLLEALENPKKVDPAMDQPVSEQPTTEKPKAATWFDEAFFDKKEGGASPFDTMQAEFSKVGTRFVDIISGALNRVKDFDFPQVGATQFEHTYTFDSLTLQNIAIDVPHGSVTFEPTDLETITVKCDVKAGLRNEEEATLEETFLKRFVAEVDDTTLRLISDFKMMQVNMTIALPKKEYAELTLKLLNGTVKMHHVVANKIRVKTYNGSIIANGAAFTRFSAESSNGAIELKQLKGRDLEVETMNGRVYIDGVIEDIDAKSLNGNVTVATKTVFASKVKAETVAGNVELYIPRNMSLKGKVVSNLGKLDVRLDDVAKHEQEQQFLQKVTSFEKEVPQTQKLYIDGQTKAGTIIVQYASVEPYTV